MSGRLVPLALMYGVAFALAVTLAESLAGNTGRVIAIVVGIALFAPYVRRAVRRQNTDT